MDRQRGRTLIPLLTKLAAPKPDDWYKHVDQVQRYLNSTISRSTGKTPFQLLVGVEMQIKENAQVRRLIDEEWAAKFEEQRRELREDAKRKIAATQEENKRNFDKRRKSAKQYLRGDLVAIKRTQFGPGLKFGGKFLGPYRVLRTMWNDRYMVEKVGEHEGPTHTSATADFMKPLGPQRRRRRIRR